jgi:hypothetical protein
VTEPIVSCIPVHDEQNAAMAADLFSADIPWLKPYPGSVEGECAAHGGKIWIGPQQQKLIATAEAAGMHLLVLCHFCAIIATKDEPGGPTLVKLSGVETGFEPGTGP